MNELASLAASLKFEAERLGFRAVGICAPHELDAQHARLREWLDRGYAGEMDYIERRFEAYRSPSAVLDGVRSIVMLALPYRTQEPQAITPGTGSIARYAWGERDYHDVIHERLKSLIRYIAEHRPEAKCRGCVDTAPLLERDFAQIAGLGWIGKNTLLLNRSLGSWFFLSALLTDLELPADRPFTADHCGTCTACLTACPTQAFPAPYVLDASRCVSYLTIEHRSDIAGELRTGLGDHLFGCDVCQDVCPWNHRPAAVEEAAFEPLAENNPIELIALFHLDDSAFRARFRATPLWRTKRRGILRNAAIVLGNQRFHAAIPVLQTGSNDPDLLIAEACRWAIGQMEASE